MNQSQNNDRELTEVVYKTTTIPANNDKWKDELLQAEKLTNLSDPLYLYLTVFIVNLLSFVSGVGLSWTSPVIPVLRESDSPLGAPITPIQESWIASLVCLGAGVGPLAAGNVADWLGRKKALIVLSFPFVIGYIMLAFSGSLYLYYIARFLVGIGIGGSCAVIPMYIGEISEDHNRGKFGCSMSLFVTLGVTYAFAVGPILSIKLFSVSCVIPAVFFLIFFTLFMPESPQFLISKNENELAEKSLMLLRNKSKKGVQKELYILMDNKEQDMGEKAGFIALFKTTGLRKGILISAGLVVLQQLSGINAVMAYLQTLIEAAGPSFSTHSATVFIGLIQTFACIVTSCVVERLGRKILLLGSVMGACASLVVLGLFFYLKEHQFNVTTIGWLPLVCLVIYVVTFNIGIGPVPWAILAEIFPSNAKSSASSLTASACFVSSWGITLAFPLMKQVLTVAGAFWFLSVVCVLGIIFIFVVVPETKGKTFTEIQQILNGRK